MRDTIKVAVSACLLGENVRYDGGSNRDSYITEKLSEIFTLVPICPEAEAGMGIPREPMHLEGEPKSPQLLTNTSHQDMTEQMRAYSNSILNHLNKTGIHGMILKARSPSCGISGVAIVSKIGLNNKSGSGLFVKAVSERLPNLPLINEEDLAAPAKRDEFFQNVKKTAGT